MEKITFDIDVLCKKLFRVINNRDTTIHRTQVNLIATTEKMNVQKDGKLRWMMETNLKNQREQFFTIWFLADTGKLREMEVLINSTPKEEVPALVNQPDRDFGLTPLHYASKRPLESIVRMLLAYGASPAARSPSDGRTPLHLAAAYSSREVLLQLLSNGADHLAVDDFGYRAVDLAEQNGNTASADTLKRWVSLNTAQLPPPLATHSLSTEGLLAERQQSRRLLFQQQLQDPPPASPIPTLPSLPDPSPSQSPSPFLHRPPQTSSSQSHDQPPSPTQQPLPPEFVPIAASLRARMDPSMSLLVSRLDSHNLHLHPPAALVLCLPPSQLLKMLKEKHLHETDAVLRLPPLGEVTLEDDLDGLLRQVQVELRLCGKLYAALLAPKNADTSKWKATSSSTVKSNELTRRECEYEACRALQRRFSTAKLLLPLSFLKTLQNQKRFKQKVAELGRERGERRDMKAEDSRSMELKKERQLRRRMRVEWRRKEKLRVRQEQQLQVEQRRLESLRLQQQEKASLAVDLDQVVAAYRAAQDQQITYIEGAGSVEEFERRKMLEEKEREEKKQEEEEEKDDDEDQDTEEEEEESAARADMDNSVGESSMEADQLSLESQSVSQSVSLGSGGSVTVTPAHPLTHQPARHLVLTAACELAELHLQLLQEGPALRLLVEALGLCQQDSDDSGGHSDGALGTARVDLLARLCDVALFAFDYLQQRPPQEEEQVDQAHLPARTWVTSTATALAGAMRADRRRRERVAGIVFAVRAIQMPPPTPPTSSASSVSSQGEAGDERVRTYSDRSRTVRAVLQERGVLRAEEGPVSRRSSFERFVCVEASNSLSLSSARGDTAGDGPSPGTLSAAGSQKIGKAPIDLEESTLVHSTSHVPGEEDAQGAGLQLLGLSLRWADEAIALLLRLYRTDLVEPLIMARLLESKSRATERLLDCNSDLVDTDLSAFDWMQRAETASRRLLGAAHEHSIRLMLEVLRLHVKYREKTAFDASSSNSGKQSFAALKAAEIGVCVVQLASKDLVQADLFTQRCAELLALSTVTANGGMKSSTAVHLHKSQRVTS